ncbi:ABC transporter permease [Pseudarthrobacter sp. N5]|uniref:ABC transporter permease n=1 Tax=Pseudarthrobacter sp. N5 TaxID=3418416 RepID=UPI003CF0896A
MVDPGYGVIHRLDVSHGAWFAADDEQRMAPAVVVSEGFYNSARRPNLATHPQVTLLGAQQTTAVMIGVVPDMYPESPPSAFMLTGAAERAGVPGSQRSQFKLWVQDGQADALKAAITSDLQLQFPGMQAQANRMDDASQGDPFAIVQLMVGGVAGLVLILGAVGMLNISMVTVRYRVREIGIRRGSGATSRRIFLGVMMESVVATAVAGVAGAMLGLGAAIFVGVLAGAIPALVAVRVKVIDAIRF